MTIALSILFAAAIVYCLWNRSRKQQERQIESEEIFDPQIYIKRLAKLWKQADSIGHKKWYALLRQLTIEFTEKGQ